MRGREGPGYISPTDQLARNRAYAKAYGHTIAEEGIDEDVSGAKMSRPVFDRFLAMIERGDADGLVVAKLDRFARSNVGALAAVEKIEDTGGVLISVAEQLDASTGAGRFMRSILFAAAQWELERIGDQWHSAHTESVRRGVHNAPYVPPGYVRGPRAMKEGEPDRQLTPHPQHAETVRVMFEMASRGESNRAIADYLNERHLPVMAIRKNTPEGELTSQERNTPFWQASRIPRLLANRAYLGEARYGEITNPYAHPALVDERTWILAQHRPAVEPELRRANANAPTPPSILSRHRAVRGVRIRHEGASRTRHFDLGVPLPNDHIARPLPGAEHSLEAAHRGVRAERVPRS